ncbi:MAG: site-specific integrase [Tardiphaga sp.]|jgi:integrase
MARKVSFSALESRSARLRLKVRRRPYRGPSLARGVALLYRRNKTNGTWVLKASDGHGAYWTKAIALADDFEDSDKKSVLTFYEAQDAAKRLARGDGDGSAGTAPTTVDGALTAYRADLIGRQSNPYNADWPRVHLSSVLLAKPVALLTVIELKRWRDNLLGTMAPSTVNRLGRCLCAALELAAQHDERIQNRQAWETGLADLPNAQQARNVVLSDAKVREFLTSAYGLDRQFALLADVLAITGARPSQAARLRVQDLLDHPTRPKIMLPKSAKGGGRNRAQKKAERYSVPITPSLSAKLKAAARDRSDDMPLLLQSDGRPWGDNPGQNYHRLVAAAVAAIGADPEATMYSLRHSSIVRALLRNVPIRLIAATHNTSTRMIEANYSKYITEHADDISRIGLLQDEPPAGDNVLALAS